MQHPILALRSGNENVERERKRQRGRAGMEWILRKCTIVIDDAHKGYFKAAKRDAASI